MSDATSATKYRAVILTALRLEYLAVRAQITDIEEKTHPQGTVYEQGRFIDASGKTWTVTLVEIGAGNPAAALETERAVSFTNPSVVFFVGVAGGLKDVALCDVVAATRVYGYESGKANGSFRPRPNVGESAYSMVQRARAEARKDNWQRRLVESKNGLRPSVHIAPIAAGEKVVASKRSETWKFLRENYGDAVAVEMEGRGFLQAAHANRAVNALVVRGISDLISDKSDADAAGFQVRAAEAASAFAFEVLANLEQSAVTVTGQYVVVLSLTISEVDWNHAEAIVAHLRGLSQDARLTLTRVEEGSVKLVLEGTLAGFEQLTDMHKSGDLQKRLGIDVISMTWVGSYSPKDSVTLQMEATVEEYLPSAKAGSREALDHLFSAIYPYCINRFRFSFGSLGRKSRWAYAEEVVNMAVMTAYTSLDRFSGNSGAEFLHWIGLLVQHQFFTQMRLHKARKRPFDPGLSHAIADFKEVRDRFDLNQELVRSLTELERQILELRYFTGMSLGAIAKQLDVSPSNVKSGLGKARAKLSLALRRLQDK